MQFTRLQYVGVFRKIAKRNNIMISKSLPDNVKNELKMFLEENLPGLEDQEFLVRDSEDAEYEIDINYRKPEGNLRTFNLFYNYNKFTNYEFKKIKGWSVNNLEEYQHMLSEERKAIKESHQVF